MAAQAANFILQHQFIDGLFHRLNYQGQTAVLAQSEDYALFIKALLDLQACFPEQKSWLVTAIALQEKFQEFLWSVELGRYYNTSSHASQDLIVRERSYADNATPSANGVAIANLVRLALLTDNLHYLDLAEEGLQAFNSVMGNNPQACPSLFTALDWYRNSTLIRTTLDHIIPLLSQYLPVTEFVVVSDLPPGSIGLVCQGFQCLAPAESGDEFWDQVRRSQTRG